MVGEAFDYSKFLERLDGVLELARAKFGDGLLLLFSSSDLDDPVYGVDTNFLYLTGRYGFGDILFYDGDRLEVMPLGSRRHPDERPRWNDDYEPFGTHLGSTLAPDQSWRLLGSWFASPSDPLIKTFDDVLESFGERRRRIFTINNLKYKWTTRATALMENFRRRSSVLGGSDVVDVSEQIHILRSVKDRWEIAALERAGRFTATIIADLLGNIVSGSPTEAELAAILQKRSGGRFGMAFDPIVSYGESSVIIHHSAGRRKRSREEHVLVDYGVRDSGYCGDVTRIFVPEGALFGKRMELLDVLEEAYFSAVEYLRPGVPLVRGEDSVHALVTRVFRRSGVAELFSHAIGHHVGLDVHDPTPPADMLVPGNVVTIEPGLYDPSLRFGIRIENTFEVTENGCRVLGSGELKGVIFF